MQEDYVLNVKTPSNYRQALSIDRISYLDRCATGFESLENSRETELNGHHQLRARLARVLMRVN